MGCHVKAGESYASRVFRLALGIGAALALCTACSNITRFEGRIGFARPNAPDDFDRLVRASLANGYELALAHPQRLRFGLYAKYSDRWVDEYGRYRIAVRCSLSECEIRPLGPRVEVQYKSGIQYLMPEPLRDELLVLQQVLQSAVRPHVAVRAP